MEKLIPKQQCFFTTSLNSRMRQQRDRYDLFIIQDHNDITDPSIAPCHIYFCYCCSRAVKSNSSITKFMFCTLNNGRDPPSCLQAVFPVPRLNKTTFSQYKWDHIVGIAHLLTATKLLTSGGKRAREAGERVKAT